MHKPRFDDLIAGFLRSTALVTAIVLSVISVSQAYAQNSFEARTRKGVVSFLVGDRLLAQYRFDPVPFKPYVQQFLTPGGVNVLRDAPHDHLHHHALMFAVGVDDVDFWGETPKDGRQVHKGLTDPKIDEQNGVDRAFLTESVNWINPADNKLLVQETRLIEVYHSKDLDASLLTWQSRFTLPPGKNSAKIWGRKYFGLGARFLPSMDKEGRFQNAEGKEGVEGTNVARSAWCAYSASADGKPVTVAIFDHPDNPRHPATWFTMGDKPNEFAYLSNTLNLEKEPLLLGSERPLRLRYGVALWDGRIDRKTVDALYRRWLGFQSTQP